MHVSTSLPSFHPPSSIPRIYLSFSFEWPRPDKQQQNKQRTSTAQQQQVYQWWTTVSTGQRGGKAPDNFQLNDKLCHYLSSSLPFSSSSLLISFYSGRGTWQSCIEWTLNRLQLYKDHLFVFPSVFPSIFPSVCQSWMPEESDTIIDLFPKLFKLQACLQLRLWTLIATAAVAE